MSYTIKDIHNAAEKENSKLKKIISRRLKCDYREISSDYVVSGCLARKVINEIIYPDVTIPKLSRQKKASWIKGVRLDKITDYILNAKINSNTL